MREEILLIVSALLIISNIIIFTKLKITESKLNIEKKMTGTLMSLLNLKNNGKVVEE